MTTPKFPKLLAIIALLGPGPAAAHSFGQVPTLPVPFWLYAWAAAATLVASFVVAGILLGRTREPPVRARPWRELPTGLLRAVRGGALFALLLCIATGLFGTSGVYANFSMTCFWVVFGLGWTWLSALVGDVHALVNPWRTLALWGGRLLPAPARVRRPYPAWLGYWPAIVLYGALVTLELFGHTTPRSLAFALLAYTGLTLAGCARFGARDWLRHGEVFAVLLHLLAQLAPVEIEEHDGGGRWRWRRPLSGLRADPAEHPSVVLFGLFLLSATAFDGLHEARPWVSLFWQQLYPRVLEPLGYSIYTAAPALMQIHRDWQLAWLLASPLLYLAAYLAALTALRALTRTRGTRSLAPPLGELALAFFPSLLPIALAYHVTHYWTLLLGQGPRIVPLLSDPFGWGWNLLGTAQWVRGSPVPDAMAVWHVQVGLILAGHVAGVAVAHLEALRRFGDRRTALRSQLPMLALMVAFTVGGLWILSLPFDPGPVRYGG